jgi:hypothetical protein
MYHTIGIIVDACLTTFNVEFTHHIMFKSVLWFRTWNMWMGRHNLLIMHMLSALSTQKDVVGNLCFRWGMPCICVWSPCPTVAHIFHVWHSGTSQVSSPLLVYPYYGACHHPHIGGMLQQITDLYVLVFQEVSLPKFCAFLDFSILAIFPAIVAS